MPERKKHQDVAGINPGSFAPQATALFITLWLPSNHCCWIRLCCCVVVVEHASVGLAVMKLFLIMIEDNGKD